MPELEDTIAAISTPIGEGGIGIVRISGPEAITVADKIFSSIRGKSLLTVPTHTITYGLALNSNSEKIDEVLASVMRAPMSYTRQDVVEINCHGGLIAVRKVLELVLGAGARLATPGEFTLRAFLNGRIDLAQAEAVMDVIRARTNESSRIALTQLGGGLSRKIDEVKEEVLLLCAQVEVDIDFSEEEIDIDDYETLLQKIHTVAESLRELAGSYERGKYFRDGLSIAIVGKPNVGKSSLLNALLESERAIVTPIAGTTRDTISESLSIDGLPVTIVDTAGIRASHDLIEKEGIARSLAAIDGADLVLPVFDATAPADEADAVVMERVKGKQVIAVLNKVDLLPRETPRQSPRQAPLVSEGAGFPSWLASYGDPPYPVVGISAKTGEGLDRLRKTIYEVAMKGGCDTKEGTIVTNLRHKVAIDTAIAALEEAAGLIGGKQPLEITAIELRRALESLGEITGSASAYTADGSIASSVSTVTANDVLNRIFSDFCIGK